jgi:uncharacterized membrane protein (DUF4010 family)
MRTWPALLLAPALVLTDQSVAYALVDWSCASQSRGLPHLVHALFLAATLATVTLAWRSHRMARERRQRDEGESGVRPALMAEIAVLVGLLSAAVIVAMWIPQWMLSPCFA